MKKSAILQILFLTMLAFSQASCAQQKSSNTITNKRYNASSFSAIETNTIGNIVFTQSPNHSVRAEGNEELVENLLVRVENNVLKISMKKKLKNIRFNRKNQKLTINITSPELQEIQSDGVGNITLKGTVKTPHLSIISDGVGNIKTEELIVETLDVESDGVGNITLKGSADSISIESDGVGNINAENFIAKHAHIRSDGVGNTRCFASESVDIDTDGVGNVTYYGNPATKNITKGGIGKVKAGE